MPDIPPDAAIVVGIDGSRAAIGAAEWAIDEAVARDVPLRLVCGARSETIEPSQSGALPLGIEYAETMLRQADAAIAATGKIVKVETAIVRGDPTAVLLTESRTAKMVCVGSTGVGTIAQKVLGSRATALAERAQCPVAIIRDPGDRPASKLELIAVAVKASTDDEDTVITAMEEARLRRVPVIAVGLWREDFGVTPYDELDHLVQGWRQRYPDVHVHPVATRAGLARFLDDDDSAIGLVIAGADEAAHVGQILGPQSHPILGHRDCSVLIVRH